MYRNVIAGHADTMVGEWACLGLSGLALLCIFPTVGLIKY